MVKLLLHSISRVYVLFIGLVAILSFALAYLYPFHLPPWTTFYNEWLFGLFLGLGCALILACGRISIPDFRFWMFVLAVVTLHTWWWGGVGALQVTAWLVFLFFGLMGWLAYCLGLNWRDSDWFYALIIVVWIVSLVSAVVAILQWSGVVSGANWDPGFILHSEGGGRVSSNIGQANNLGTLLVLGIGSLGYAWYAIAQRSMLFLLLAASSLIVLVFGLYCSGSRTATLNLMIWPLLLGVWARWRGSFWPKISVLPIVLLSVFYLIMPLVVEWWGLFPPQDARSLVSDGNRPRLWMMVLTAIVEKPWFGYGFGAIGNIHLNYSLEFGSFDYSIANQAHNTILDMWAIFGLPLGSLIVGGVLWMWGRAWFKSRSVAEQFIWLMTTAMLVHAMLEYPLHYGFFFWLLCLLLGALGAKEWRVINIRHALPASMVWLAVYMTVALPVWRAYVQTESLYTAYRQRGPEVARQLIDGVPNVFGKLIYPELYDRLHWNTASIDEILNLSDRELAALSAQAIRYPQPTVGWGMAFAQAARGNVEQATWWAERMCRMFDPRVCASAAEEWMRRGAENPKWPALPWEKWLPKSSAAH